MAEYESFQFYKGMNRRKSRLYLEDGEVYTADNFSFESEGVLEARPAKTQSIAIDTDSDSTINGIHRYIDSVIASSHAYCPGEQSKFNYIYQRDKDASAYTNIGLMAGQGRPRFVDYEKFIFVVDGESSRAYIDEKEYEWRIPDPVQAPTVTAGAAGNPDGEYTCWYTYYVIFPNGKTHETGKSPSATVTLSSEIAEWSAILDCPYAGEELDLRKRLYRTVEGYGYLAAEIANGVTTYSDDETDANLQAATAFANDNYGTPPEYAIDIALYLQRIFFIKDNTLYWTETYQPFAVLTTSSAVVTKDDENLVGVINWGDQLYMASKYEWYRLQGSDPDTWAVKRTFTDNGIVNRHTIKKTKFGIIGLDYDGIHLFDGATSRNLTEKKLGKSFFTDLDDLTVCYAEFDGEIYYFYYASSGSTLDSCLRLDFTYGPTNFQVYTGGFVDAHYFYREETVRYQAYSGYEYSEGGTETISTSILSGDRGFGAIQRRKNLSYLYYDIDTNSIDVTVTVYVDGTASHTITLNTSSRQRKRSQKFPQIEGYRFSLGIDCSDSQNLKIYDPWLLEGDFVGY